MQDITQDYIDPETPYDILNYDQATPWSPSVNIVPLMGVIIQLVQASALLAGAHEQCLTAAPMNAVRFPRYPSIAILNASPSRISRCLSPLLATALLVGRVALHEKHNMIGPFLGLVVY